DRYIYGNAERLSPEAPVPVLHFQRDELRLGGAGNVAACLAALRAQVDVIGIVGNDELGAELRKQLADCGCQPGGLIAVKDRRTVCKTRLIGYAQHKNPQQLIRLDYEDPAPIDAELETRVLANFTAALANADVVCLEDYNKGLLTPNLTRRLIALARQKNIPVIVDPANIPDYSKYAGATAVKLNRVETEKATGLRVREESDYRPAAERLLQTLQLDAVIMTLDRQGSYLASKSGAGGDRRWLRTRERQVADGTGAGDVMLAMISIARAAGASWPDAVALANVAGGLEVERFGVVPIKPAEIIVELLHEEKEFPGKQRSLTALAAELAYHRACGKRIVFTNGCFDLIHLGHIQYFRYAKSQGDLLVVGVNTDASIRRLKGDKRPIVGEQDRLSVLEELESIDYLALFDDDTPLNLIEKLKPDVLVKGADYRKDQVVGWDIVEKSGGKVCLAPLVDGRSTSAVIQRILEAYGEKR
ncbi:MAG TPA: D-glycero-beta-D-manno-heptose 1-phosphate adenylyltransferase, partial [Tepidisphaeraceae bacterium]|nr:D-glycero-beta-D-manno-heptose 1-phosphate adenylyltransferase [Tepidisphaeraceae bacterium]